MYPVRLIITVYHRRDGTNLAIRSDHLNQFVEEVPVNNGIVIQHQQIVRAGVIQGIRQTNISATSTAIVLIILDQMYVIAKLLCQHLGAIPLGAIVNDDDLIIGRVNLFEIL